MSNPWRGINRCVVCGSKLTFEKSTYKDAEEFEGSKYCEQNHGRFTVFGAYDSAHAFQTTFMMPVKTKQQVRERVRPEKKRVEGARARTLFRILIVQDMSFRGKLTREQIEKLLAFHDPDATIASVHISHANNVSTFENQALFYLKGGMMEEISFTQRDLEMYRDELTPAEIRVLWPKYSNEIKTADQSDQVFKDNRQVPCTGE